MAGISKLAVIAAAIPAIALPGLAKAQFPGTIFTQTIGVFISLNMDTHNFDDPPFHLINNGQIRTQLQGGVVYLIPINGSQIFMSGAPTAANPWGCINPARKFNRLKVSADNYHYCLMTSSDVMYSFTKGLASQSPDPSQPGPKVSISYVLVGTVKP